MSQIYNQIENALQESIDALVRIYPFLSQVPNLPAIYNNKQDSNIIPIISGGGSGHEPAHFGYVGEGMLTAAISGPIFEPPKAKQIFELIKFVDKGKGVFLIIKNFEKDLKEFSEAITLARQIGIKIKYIVSHDDISIEKLNFRTRHRGVAGTILLHKILGYYALNGASLDELEQVALKLSTSMATLGVATKPANLPNHENDMFKLAPDTISYGIGIHGEEGYRTEKFISSELLANELINKLRMNLKWKPKDPYILLINNLGATTRLEELIFSNDVLQLLDIDGLNIKFIKLGRLITSLNMAGISITLCKLANPDWEEALNSSTNAPSW